MRLENIAWQSLKRRKVKAAFVLLGLTLGVGTAVGLWILAETLTSEINHKLEKYGANIIITPRSETLSLAYEGLSLGGFSFQTNQLSVKDVEAVRKIKNWANLAAVGPVVLGPVRVQDREVLLAGVDFKAGRILKPWWKILGREPAEGEALAGARAAQVLGLVAGRTVNLANKALPVSGVLEATGSQDDDIIFTRLETARNLLEKPGLVSMIEVAALCLGCPIEEMVRQMSAALPGASVMAIMSVVKGRMETLETFKRVATGLSVLVILLGGLLVLVTMMANVKERTVEIGILRAIGFRRRHVMSVILVEAALVSALAGLLGYLAGVAGAKLALPFLADGGHRLALDPLVAPMALIVAVGLGQLAGLIPALIAARLDPVEALRGL